MAKLSPTQQEALDTAQAHGGRLVREPGGFWTYEGCPRQEGRTGAAAEYPAWHVATGTIKSLVGKGVLRECDWRQTGGFNRPSRFAVAVEVVPQ